MEDQEQEENKMDVITVDVPLFIRLLEFAREDATDDMMLHDVAEKLIEMCADGDIMQMEQYDEIVGSKEDKAATSGMNAVEDNMHPQDKDKMNTINEQRWMKLAGLLNENQIPQDIEEFLDGMINTEIPEDAEEGEMVTGVWDASEYTNEETYGEAANEFKSTYDYIKSQGGKIIVPGNPDVTYIAVGDGDIGYGLKVTLN